MDLSKLGIDTNKIIDKLPRPINIPANKIQIHENFSNLLQDPPVFKNATLEETKYIREVLTKFKDVFEKFIEVSLFQAKTQERQNTITLYITIVAAIATVISMIGTVVQVIKLFQQPF